MQTLLLNTVERFELIETAKYLLNNRQMATKKESKNVEKKTKPSVALFGFGRMGRIRFENLAKLRHLIHISYVIDDFQEEIQAAMKLWDLEKINVLSIAESHFVWMDESVDGVIITTSTDSHFDIVKTALESGKHVMVEKPVCGTVEDTLECYRISENKGKHLLCAMNRRFDPDFIELYKKLRNGNIGEPRLGFYANRDHPGPSKEFQTKGGGMFLDMGTHMADIFCWLTGERPTLVTAMAHASEETTVKNKDFDGFGMMMKFPCGLIAYSDSIKFTKGGYDQRLEVIGSKGALLVENKSETNVSVRNEEGTLNSPLPNSFPERYKESYVNDILHFIEILNDKAQPSVTVNDISAALQISIAAEESARTGRQMRMKWQ